MAGMRCVVAAFSILGLISSVGAFELALDVSNKEQEWKERPVAKVIGLLRDMKAQLEREASEDTEMYDAMVCWCQTNDKAKTKAVADGQAKDKLLTTLIPALAAKATKLSVEMDALNKEISHNEEALQTASSVREKELEEFRDEERSAVDSISGLKNALGALSKQHALDQQALLQVSTAAARLQLSSSSSSSSSFSSSSRSSGFMQRGPAQLQQAVAAFLEQRQAAAAGRSPHQEFAPQSGEIFGILKGMQESFEQNLANAQEEEKQGKKAYEELKAAKTVEINDAEEQVSAKSESKARTNEQLSTSKEDLEDTRSTVSSDTDFLLDLQERCGSMDHTFEQRRKVRAEETTAVAQTIEILNGEEAHSQLGRTLGLLQLNSVSVSDASSRMEAARAQASKILFDAAKRLASPQLSILAATVKDDVFAKIKNMIDKLIGHLKQQHEEEVAQRDECIEGFNTNEKETFAKNSNKDDVNAKIESLTLLTKKLDEEIAVAKQEIAVMQIEVKQASTNRVKENEQFQTSVGDQQATQAILHKALDKLKAFYDKKAAAMLQVHVVTKHRKRSQQSPPQMPTEYKTHGSSAGVMGMIEMIINDSKKTEDEVFADEQEAQNNYEKFIKDSNSAMTALNKSISDKTERKASADGDKLRAQDDLAGVNEDLASLGKVNADLHTECDFLMQNFQDRQASRVQEMEALEKAKAMMSGADMK